MVLELEKPRVTELQVRMDCNGCVHKIKKAMHGVDGVYDISIDFAQQKLTVVGRAELDKILRAIKKTRKTATICSHTDPNAPPPEPAPAPAPAPPAELPAPESAASNQPPPAEEAPKEPTPPAAEAKPPTEAAKDAAASAEPKVIEEVHMVHHYPYNYSATCNRHEYESPMYVYPWPMPAPKNRYNNWVEACDPDYYYYQSQRAGCGSRNITSIFSEENPNNCAIM